MKKETAIKFIEDNRDALLLLSDKVRNAELRAEDGEAFMRMRGARFIVETWISDIFSIAYTVDDFPTEEESIYRRLDRERQEGRPDAY